jgi:hypothetical protein
MRSSQTLYEELKHKSLIKNEKQWLDIQISFLQSHQYHTEYARKNLEKEKRKRVEELKSSVRA